MAAQVIVQEHFQGLKSRPAATGLSTAGISLGAMAYSPITRLLIDAYGWRGALMLVSGCTLQLLVPAALFRPPRRDMTSIAKTEPSENHKNSVCTSVRQALKNCFDPAFAHPSFIIHLCGVSTIMFALDTIDVRSAARAESVGIDPFRASLIVTISAPFSAFGRVVSGFIARCILPRNLFGGGLVSGGIATILSGLFAYDKFVAHAFFCSWFLLSNGEFNSQYHFLCTSNTFYDAEQGKHSCSCQQLCHSMVEMYGNNNFIF